MNSLSIGDWLGLLTLLGGVIAWMTRVVVLLGDLRSAAQSVDKKLGRHEADHEELHRIDAAAELERVQLAGRIDVHEARLDSFDRMLAHGGG